MTASKETYEKPAMQEHGDVREITLHGGDPNNDIPNGPGDTAFS